MDEQAAAEFLSAEVAKLEAARNSLGIQEIIVQGTDVLVRFLRAKDGKHHAVRFRCDGGFPIEKCASVDFVDPEDLQDKGAQSWPQDGEQAIKARHSPPFVCLPGVREYHEAPGNHGGKPTREVASLVSIMSNLIIKLNK
jgi:hypothetical protein